MIAIIFMSEIGFHRFLKWFKDSFLLVFHPVYLIGFADRFIDFTFIYFDLFAVSLWVGDRSTYT